MKSAFAVTVLFFSFYAVINAADPTFALADLGADERLLFTSTAEQPGWGTFSTLFEADLDNSDTLGALTHFPERSRYFPLTGELEIQNRYGLYRSSVNLTPGLKNLDFYPSFTRGSVISSGRVLPVSSSPDGKWVLVQEATSSVRGNLVIYSSTGGAGHLISRNHVLDYKAGPGIWSPDSRYLFYSRDDTLYSMASRQLEESLLPDESYRIFGPGGLSSVRWRGPDSLFYIRDSSVSLVRSSELFTRSFYSDPLPAGVSIANLPVVFDSQFDSFWPAPDGKSILILKSDRALFKFPLISDNLVFGESLPFLMLPEDSSVLQVWWRNDGEIFVLTGGRFQSSIPKKLYILSSLIPESFKFQDSGIDEIRRFAPSPDRETVAILQKDAVSLRDSGSLEESLRFYHPDPRDIFWIDGNNLLVTGGKTSEIIPLDGSPRRTIALSAADRAGFDSTGGILADVGGNTFRREDRERPWTVSNDSWTGGKHKPSLESPGHRVYTENLSSAAYGNLIKIRTVEGFGNRDLFPVPVLSSGSKDGELNLYSRVPEDSGVINHGSRNGERELALVFNAIDNAEGLGEILNLLSDYHLKVTFFMSGDFIRNQPDAARLIADSGHEIGSLFYTHMDMTDFRYRVDKDFIIRGLGRNEDEFFRTTGSEVSTIWHAPWYIISPPIQDATLEMGYQYIGRDVDPLDWVVSDGPAGTRDLYRPSAELVEMTLEMKLPGSIIPVRVGKPGIRDDYYYRNLELLINGILNDGFEIVTVGELREGLQ